MRRKDKGLPVAREEGLLVEPVAGETVVYDEKSKEAHCLSALPAVVFANCDGRTTIEQLASLSAERLGEPVDAESVLDALAQLEERELMAVPAKPRGDLSRRDLMRRAQGRRRRRRRGVDYDRGRAQRDAAQTATCANLLCCPCCTVATLNKEECCTIPNGDAELPVRRRLAGAAVWNGTHAAQCGVRSTASRLALHPAMRSVLPCLPATPPRRPFADQVPGFPMAGFGMPRMQPPRLQRLVARGRFHSAREPHRTTAPAPPYRR